MIFQNNIIENLKKKKRTLNSAVSLRLEKNLFACFSHLKQLLLEIRKSPFSWSGCRVLSFRTELTSITKYVNLLWNPLYIYIHIYVYVYKYYRVLPFGITSIFQELVNFIYSIAFSSGFCQMSQKLPPLFEISQLDASSNLRDGVLRRYMI